MALINVKVVKINEEAESVRSFLLQKIGFFKLPKYEPGSHIDVHCGEGIIRQYSLCGDPDDCRHFQIAVKKNEPSRGGSELMHEDVKEDDRLEIGTPRNNFPLHETASHYIFLAAGIGITPIIAMADRLQKLNKPFEVHYFTRGEKHTTFRDRLTSGAYAKKVTLYEGLNLKETQAQLSNILGTSITDGQIYMCGPTPFMDSAKAIAQEKWPTDAIKLERFAADLVLAGAPTSPFILELARSGVTLDVGADETILNVLEANGIDAAFSCEQGVCGTCVSDIIEGVPDHRDAFLSVKQQAAGKQMCICVSRAKTDRLVIDL